jgi:hypothetical protein
MGGPPEYRPARPVSAGAVASAAPVAEELRAVIWHAPGSQLPGELLSSLSKRIAKMRLCSDGYTALAQACLIERERRGMVLAGQTPNVGGALVLIEPATLPAVAEIVEALRTYAPATTCWMYAKGANPALRGVVESDVRAWSRSTPTLSIDSSSAEGLASMPAVAHAAEKKNTTTPDRSNEAPQTKVTENGATSTGRRGALNQSAPTEPEQPQARFALTSDELRMLLSTDDDTVSADVARTELRAAGRRVIGGASGGGAPA